MPAATPAERVARITKEISGVRAQYHITSKDNEFLANAVSRRYLTPKQEQWMADIERKVFNPKESKR